MHLRHGLADQVCDMRLIRGIGRLKIVRYFEDADDVDLTTSTQRVVNDVEVSSREHRDASSGAHRLWRLFRWDNGAVGDVSSASPDVVGMELAAQARAQAIGRHQGTAAHGSAIGGLHMNCIVVLRETFDSECLIQIYVRQLPRCAQQDLVQVDSMNRDVWRRIALLERGAFQWDAEYALAVVSIEQQQLRRQVGCLQDLLLHAQAFENRQDVGANLHPVANRGNFRRLLQQSHLAALLAKCQCRRHATQPSADNDGR